VKARSWLRILFQIGLGLALTGCEIMSTRVAGGGSGSESTNGTLIGAAIYSDKTPAMWASVFIREENYLRDTAKADRGEAIPNTLTDHDGKFAVNALPAGVYSIEIRDEKGMAVHTQATVIAKKIGKIPEEILLPTCTIEGALEAIPGASAPSYVQIFGLDRATRTDSMGRFAFSNLPAGNYRVHGISSLPNWAYPDPVSTHIASGDTLELGILPLKNFFQEDYGLWHSHRIIKMNTVVVGITSNLTDFPILVRLDSNNFNFSESNGHDLRFSASTTTHLSYEIERFDAEKKKAEVWVSLDTLLGSNSDQYIIMHWGNPAVPDFSNGKMVFGAYAGIWHMRGQAQGGEEFRFPDASPFSIAGTGNATPEESLEGLGSAGTFLGEQFVKVPASKNLMSTTLITVSAWVRTKSLDSAGGEVISMGDNYGVRIEASGNMQFFVFDDTLYKPGDVVLDDRWNICYSKGVNLLDNQWHQLAVEANESTLRVYIDGALRGAVSQKGKIKYPFGTDFWIGRHGYGIRDKDFRGQIDEVRVSNQVNSLSRIKADYESGKMGSALLEFR
jgi:hypothetical protein